MAISDNAMRGTNAVRTLKLHAYIGSHQAIVVVDSGSSHNFISEQMASLFQSWTPLKQQMSIRVADGSQLSCTHEVANCSWSTQGTLFNTSFIILPLKCYDAILGMEWLEQFSPMQIEWKQKWLSFLHKGVPVTLHDIQDTSCNPAKITVNQLIAMEKDEVVWGMVQIYTVEEPENVQPVPLPKGF